MSVPLFHMIAGAPEPVAPFSHAVEQDGWVFVTGQLPFTGLANDSPYPEGIEAQTRQVLANLQRVLAGCGLGFEHVSQRVSPTLWGAIGPASMIAKPWMPSCSCSARVASGGAVLLGTPPAAFASASHSVYNTRPT